MKVTVCEMSDDRKKFAAEWKGLVTHVKKEKSDLVLLPEMPFYYWFCSEPKFDPKTWEKAVDEHRKWIDRLEVLGAQTVLASRPAETATGRHNQGFVWTKDAGARGVHLKSYLPDHSGYYEASWYQRGDRVFAPFKVDGMKVGFMICSDLWAMPFARSYGKGGVSLLAVPRATGIASVEKWVAAGKVAAVLSGAYCLSSNRVGRRGEADFGGRGWIIGPDGEVIALTSKKKPVVSAEIDPRKARSAKKTYPRDSLLPD